MLGGQNTLDALYWIINIVLMLGAVAIIALVLMQKSDDGGLGAAFGGSSDSVFGNKNKIKSAQAKMQRYTVILGIAFAVLSIALCLLIKFA